MFHAHGISLDWRYHGRRRWWSDLRSSSPPENSRTTAFSLPEPKPMETTARPTVTLVERPAFWLKTAEAGFPMRQGGGTVVAPHSGQHQSNVRHRPIQFICNGPVDITGGYHIGEFSGFCFRPMRTQSCCLTGAIHLCKGHPAALNRSGLVFMPNRNYHRPDVRHGPIRTALGAKGWRS